MRARMNNPAMIIPEAMQALQALAKATENQGVPKSTINLIHLRASQINGCSVCVDMHARDVKRSGDSDERLYTVAAWRDAPYFTTTISTSRQLTETTKRFGFCKGAEFRVPRSWPKPGPVLA